MSAAVKENLSGENRRRVHSGIAVVAGMDATVSPDVALRLELPTDWLRVIGTFVALAVAVFGVYARAIDAPFIFDDVPGIVRNPSIERLWPLIGDAEHPGPFAPPALAPTARRPLSNLTFALSYRVGDLHPAGYRIVSLLLHVLSAALLAAIVRRTLRLPYFAAREGERPAPDVWRRAAWPLSVAVAFLWALHPLASEAVTYVTQRTELLVALFYLLTLWAALRYWTAASARARGVWLAVALVACLAGAASKEVIVSAPLVLLLFEATFLVGSPRVALRRSWPLYATLTLAWALLAFLSYSGVGGLSDPRHRVPLYVWWMTQAKVALLYARLAVWPWPLSIHYAPAFLRTFDAAWPWLAAAALAAAATIVLVRRRPAARFVVLAAVLILAPTFVVPLPKMVAAERRMYLPLAGLVALAVVGGFRLLASRRRPPSAAVSVLAATVVIAAASAVTVHRLAAYESSEAIWRDAVRHQPDDPMAHYNFGVALVERGRPQEARAQFEETLRLDPAHTGAHDNLGMVLEDAGRPQEAIEQFEEALRIDPGDATAHNNLGAVLTSVGRPQDAIAHLHEALRLAPDEPKAKVHRNLGNALLATGRTAEAVAQLREAVRLAPDDADAHYGLGTALIAAGQAETAVQSFEQALSLDPGDAEAENALGGALLRTDHPQQAIDAYRRALELKPDYAEAHNNLGVALLHLGRTDDAIEQFAATLRVQPDHANAQFNLGNALLQSGRPRDAVEHLEAAVRLDPEDAQARLRCAIAYARSGEPHKASAMAEDALARARAHGDGALADEIAAWLGAPR